MPKSKLRKNRNKGVPKMLWATKRYNFNSYHHRNRVTISKSGAILNMNGAPTIYYR